MNMEKMEGSDGSGGDGGDGGDGGGVEGPQCWISGALFKKMCFCITVLFAQYSFYI